jgi:hypothetical protein
VARENKLVYKYNELRGDYKELLDSFDQSEELRNVYKQNSDIQQERITKLEQQLA